MVLDESSGESELSSPRTQQSDPGHGYNPDFLIQSQIHQPLHSYSITVQSADLYSWQIITILN